MTITPPGERALACAIVAVIVLVGVLRGFHGLNLLDRVSLIGVLLLVVVVVVVLLAHDIGNASAGTLRLPPGPPAGLLQVLLTLGGVVITVQGFETVRFLGDQYDAQTRIRSSRIAQIASSIIYLALVAVATPVMGLGTPAGQDGTLLELIRRVAPLLALPLVVIAVMSQLSAAVADTVAANGNLKVSVGGCTARGPI